MNMYVMLPHKNVEYKWLDKAYEEINVVYQNNLSITLIEVLEIIYKRIINEH